MPDSCAGVRHIRKNRILIPGAQYEPHFKMLALPMITQRMAQATPILVGATILLCLVRWTSQRLRLKRLGKEAPAVAYWAPLGRLFQSTPFPPELILELLQELTFLQQPSIESTTTTFSLGHAKSSSVRGEQCL